MLKFINRILDIIDWFFELPLKFYQRLVSKTSWIIRLLLCVMLYVLLFVVVIYKCIGLPLLGLAFLFTILFGLAFLNDTTSRIINFLAPYLENSFKVGKYYIHPKLLLLNAIGILLIALAVYCDVIKLKISSAFLGVIVLAAGFRGTYRFRYDEYVTLTKPPEPIIEIHDLHILFEKHYWFGKATVNKSPMVKAEQINEAILLSSLVSIVINSNEVIFLNDGHTDELRAFAERNNIPVSERTDVWSLILNPFLDTSYDNEEKEREFEFEFLEQEGFSRKELKSLRCRVSFSMYNRTFATWEWMYYGHWDVLRSHYTFPWKNFYWESMEIALRNFKTIDNHSST